MTNLLFHATDRVNESWEGVGTASVLPDPAIISVFGLAFFYLIWHFRKLIKWEVAV